jgi:ATP-binding cassette subfamily B multidrug efflux pump
MKSLWKMFRFIKPYRWQALGAMLLLVGMTASDLLIPRLTQQLIDEGIAYQNVPVILNTALLMLGAATLSALFSVGNTILAVRVGQGLGADLRSTMVRKVQTFSFGNLDHIQTGQLLVRATSDVNQVQMIFQMSMRIMTRAPMWAVGSIVMLILTSPRLALVMLALLPVIAVLIWLFMFKAHPMFEIVQKRLDKLNTVLQENLSGVRVVKAFVRTAHENVRFGKANDELTEQSRRVARLTAALIPTMRMLVSIGVISVVWFGGSMIIDGEFQIGKMMASINYMSRSLFPLVMLGGMIGPLSAADASAGRILEVLNNEPEVKNRAQTKALPQARGRIAFENVCFGYDGADCAEPVLKDVSLVAEPGETVALLGATGSGKSTLIHLIPRFYDVDAGRITLDGVDVRDLPLSGLRAEMGIALQEAVLFSGTIRDNIRYGRPSATDEEVVAAARAAQAHDFVASFPNGYDSMIGQRGVNLSGGQKQRIAIARALLVQPKVLILDDSTSAVDVETEAKIQDALQALMNRHTSFIIAQRVSTVLNATKIVVLDRGQLTAVGTHDELMDGCSIYREIYESQLGNGNREYE